MALCRELDLFPPQLMVLKALDRPRPMSEVAATLACDSSNLTGITDRLEERGLVRRSRRREGPARQAARPHRRGKAGAAQGGRPAATSPPAAIDALSDRDLATLERLLGKALAAV